MRKTLTTKYLDALTAPAGDRLEVWDIHTPGLVIRAGDRSKAWVVFYRVHGTRRRQTLGRYPTMTLAAARTAASDVLKAVSLDRDPAAEVKAAQAHTFEALALDYLERHAKPRKKSWRNDQRILDKHLTPVWGPRPVTTITRRDVRDRLDAIAETAPVQANRVRALCSKVFRYALARDWVTVNPVAGLPALTRERSRERCLTREEVATFWQALDTQDAAGELEPAHADQLRLRLLLGQRGGEVAGMRWEDVVDGLWTQRHPKNGRVHVLPITDAMHATLDRQRVRVPDGCPWVFPDSTLTGPDIHRAWRAVERLKDDGTTTHGLEAFGIADAKGHDLRRTCATHLARLGVAPHVIGRLLNHAGALGAVTGIYNRHSYLPELQTALDLWAREITQLATGTADSGAAVVPFGRR